MALDRGDGTSAVPDGEILQKDDWVRDISGLGVDGQHGTQDYPLGLMVRSGVVRTCIIAVFTDRGALKLVMWGPESPW